jgi:hypothetical protein
MAAAAAIARVTVVVVVAAAVAITIVTIVAAAAMVAAVVVARHRPAPLLRPAPLRLLRAALVLLRVALAPPRLLRLRRLLPPRPRRPRRPRVSSLLTNSRRPPTRWRPPSLFQARQSQTPGGWRSALSLHLMKPSEAGSRLRSGFLFARTPACGKPLARPTLQAEMPASTGEARSRSSSMRSVVLIVASWHQNT